MCWGKPPYLLSQTAWEIVWQLAAISGHGTLGVPLERNSKIETSDREVIFQIVARLIGEYWW